jgi:hypothetical protein
MVDIDLIVRELRANGHVVEDMHHTSPDAGQYEMIIDGTVVNLEGARGILELDQSKQRRPKA